MLDVGITIIPRVDFEAALFAGVDGAHCHGLFTLSVLGLFPRLLSLLVLSNQSALAELLDYPFGELFTALTVLGLGESGVVGV